MQYFFRMKSYIKGLLYAQCFSMSEKKLSNSYSAPDPSFSTKAIHQAYNPNNDTHRAVCEPIYLSSIYVQDAPSNKAKDNSSYDYTRDANPTRTVLEKSIASLEGAKYGLAFSSGVSAAHFLFLFVEKGDHVIVQKNMYRTIHQMFQEHQKTHDVDFVDASDLSELKKVLRPNTKLLWLETPSNPKMQIVDLKSAASIAKEIAANVVVVCDNTFLTPYFQRPLSLGVDISMMSCTKFLNGHSDTLTGFISFNREDLNEKLKSMYSNFGSVPSSFDCFLLLRSLKTLDLRMEKHMSNALKVARFLQNHPFIEKVLHPGLPEHPQNEIATRQSFGHSGIFSFYLKEQSFHITSLFLQNLKLVLIAGSLGGVGTTIRMQSQMPPNHYPPEVLKYLNITDGFLRISVGLENPDDIINDIDQALKKTFENVKITV